MNRALGDSHNFGRTVEARGDRIFKPRTLVWERLVLSPESALRKALGETFSFLPSLSFFDRGAVGGGEVERVELAPLPKLSRARRRELAVVTGRAIALFTWLGIADLHWENLVLGRDGDRLVFGPLDVEMILADLALPTETKLLPDADPEVSEVCRHAAGGRRVLPFLGKPIDVGDLVAMAAAYREALDLLDGEARAIAAVFLGAPKLHEAPIRILLRGTAEYVRARTEPVWPPLLDAEAEQLARGDIPYFFRLYGRTGIHAFADPKLGSTLTLPRRGDVPRLDPLLSLARGLKSPNRRRLREEGLFTVLGAFDHPSFEGRHQADGLAVTFSPRRLTIALPNGEELVSKRDLGGFVSSVYLDCRCGEVGSVFVPSTTRCELRSDSRRRRS